MAAISRTDDDIADAQTEAVSQQCATTPTSRFFSLSAELRNIIYAEVTIQEDALWVTASRRTAPSRRALLATASAITRVCRSIRAEALSLIYGNNTFSITILGERNVVRAKRWAATLGDAGAQHIKHLRLHGHLGLRHARTNVSQMVRFSVSKNHDGTVSVSDCGYEYYGRNVPHPEVIEVIKACTQNVLEGLKPLSRYTDTQALVETFASELCFPEYLTETDDSEADEEESAQGEGAS